MTLREKYNMLRHTLNFYAQEMNYTIGGSKAVAVDRGQRAREILEITDGPETEENRNKF